MRILLTNDDGIDAPGINILAEKLQEKHEIIVIAPAEEQSAASHSITLFQPIRILDKGENRFAVTGTPTDCISIAFQTILKKPVDLVISGINGGQNMSEDVLYSGTVAAALEAMFLGNKAIAISLASYTDQKFETAAFYMDKMLDNGIMELIGKKEILNINIPNVEISEVKGIKITELGHRHYTDFVKEKTDKQGNTFYYIGGDEPFWCLEDNKDSKAIAENFISITPIYPDFTKKDSIPKIRKWIDEMSHEEH